MFSLELATTAGYERRMTQEDRQKLRELSAALRREQEALLLAAARASGLPSNSTIHRVAQLELNIAAIENTLDD